MRGTSLRVALKAKCAILIISYLLLIIYSYNFKDRRPYVKEISSASIFHP